MSAAPRVSVVMPVYNAVDHVEAAVDSVLAQSLCELELIIVDDGSDDGSRERAAAYVARDARVRLIRLERDGVSIGPARARNIGNAAARAPYIAAMDADDIALPDRLAATLDYLRTHHLDAVGGQIEVIGGSPRPYWFPAGHDAIAAEAVFRIPLMQSAKLARAEVLRAHPYVSPAIYEDYGWIVGALLGGLRLGNAPETVVRRRLWEGQNTLQREREGARDLRRFRLQYLTGRFGEIDAHSFAALDRAALQVPIESREELSIVGRWLIRLAATDDPKLIERLRWRWEDACKRATCAIDAMMVADTDHAIAVAANHAV